MKNVCKKLAAVLVSALLMLICSCNIVGLGEAVDTVPPSVSITTPEADSKIRDTFVMSGAWSDDLSVAKIEVLLTNLSTGTEYGPFDATKEGSKETVGTWSCTVSPIDEDGTVAIPDGVYTATITAIDTYDQKGTTTQTFGIDNTCPILTITSPSTTDDIAAGVKLASYGKIFDIKGEYSDDSGVDAIEVTFFDEEGNEIDGATTSLKVKGTTIDDSVAVFGAADGLYEKLYGTDKDAGTKSFYCTITIYDTARKVPAVEGDKGNACEYFFLTDEITEKYFSEEAAGNFKAKEAYAIMSGEKTAADVSEYYEAWYKDLSQLQKKRASFTINPANNPTFSVTGYTSFVPGGSGVSATELDTMSENVGLYEFKDKSQISITVSPGLDGYGLKSTSLKIHMIECDVAGNVQKNNDGTYVNDVVLENVEVTSIGSSYTLETGIKADSYDGIEIGKYYVISVEGTDTKGNVVSNGGSVYAIKYMPANTTAPNVKITKINSEENASSISIKGTDSISIEGSLSYFPDAMTLMAYIGNPDEGGELIYTTEEIVEQAVAPATGSYGFTVSTPVLDNQKRKANYSITIPNSKISEKVQVGSSGSVSFEVFIVSHLKNANVDGSSYFQATIDRDAPVFDSDYSVTPEVEVTESAGVVNKVNGIVKLEVNVSDNVTMNPAVQYSLDNGSTWSTAVSTRKISLSLDTTRKALADDSAASAVTPFNGDWVIKFKATDKVGNVGFRDDIVLKVDQSTDRPYLYLSNVYDNIKTLDDIFNSTPKKNIYGTQSNNKISGSVTDDDGIDFYQIIFDGTPYDGGSKFGDSDADKIEGNGKTSASISCTVPEVEGTYDLYIYIKDSKQDSTGYNTYNPGKTIKFATIAVDEGAPNFVITTTSGSLQAANQNCPVAGNWSDGTPITIERCTSSDNGKTVVKEVSSNDTGSSIKIYSNGTWEDTIPADIVGNDGCERFYVATDKYGQKTQQSFNAKVDSKAPLFTITSVNGEPKELLKNSGTYPAYAKTSGIFTVKGTIAEPDADNIPNNSNEGSGLDDFVYYYLTSDASEISVVGDSYEIDGNSKVWQKASITKTTKLAGNSENGEWTANIDISSGYVEGTSYTLYIAAKDKARNVSKISENPSAKVILKPDAKPPVFTDKDDAVDGIQALEVSNTNIIGTTNEDITFKVEVTDATSGVKSVQLYRNGVDTGLTSTPSGNKYTFTIKVADFNNQLSAGTNVFTVRATDIVGNSADCTAVEVNVDRTKPKVNISGVVPTVSSNGKTCVNGKVTVSGTATDETGLKEIRYFFGTVASPYTAVTGQVVDAESEGTYKPYDIVVDTTKLSDKATTKMTIVSVDKAGNISEIATRDLYVDQSTDKPVITPKAPLSNTNVTVADIGEGHNLFTTSSTISADISDDDGIKSVEIFVNGTKNQTASKTYTSPYSTTTTVSWSLSDLGISTVGDYKIQIKVTDSALGVTQSTNEINIGIDDGAPSLAIATTADDKKVKDGIYYVKDGFKITATVKDDYELASLIWTEQGITGNNSVEVTANNEEQTKEVTFTVNQNNSKPTDVTASKKSVYTFVATDKFGQNSEKKVQTYIYDFDVPEISNVKVGDNDLDASKKYFYTLDKSLTITGEAKETGTAGLQSGLEAVYFGVAKGNVTSWPTETAKIQKNWQSTTGTSSWTAKIDSDSVGAEGEYTVFIRAIDFAGNETIYANPVKIVADAAKPVIKVTKINSTANSKFNSYYTDKVVIEGTVTETYLRGFTVTAKKDNAKVNVTVDTKPKTTGTYKNAQAWKITVPAKDGEYNVTITAKDELNSVDYTDISFAIDTVAPTFEITNVKGAAENLGAESTPIERYGNKTDSFIIKGKVDDPVATGATYASGVATSINYIIKKTDEALEDTDSYDITSSWSSVLVKSNGTWEAPVSFSDFTDGDACYVYFAVQDKAGNVSTRTGNPSNKITVKIDGTVPTVKAPVLNIGATETTISVAVKDVNADGTKAGSGIATAVLKLDGNLYEHATLGTPVAEKVSEVATGYDIYTFTIKNDEAELNPGNNPFTVTFTDKAGNSKTSAAIQINNSAPVFSNVEIDNANDRNRNGEYVYENKKFTIGGNVSVSGNNKLDSVTWTDTYGAVETPTTLKNGTYTVTSGIFGEEIDSSVYGKAYENKLVTRTITAKNVFGTENTATVKFVTDITAPAYVTTVAAEKTGVPALRYEGKIYNADIWHKSTTLSINGSILDNESGIEKVSYSINGTSGEIYTSKVQSGTDTYYVFKGTSGAFVEGSGTNINKISFTVTDKAGNTTELTDIPNVKIDTEPAKITDLKFKYAGESSAEVYERAILTNKGKNVILSGKFSDEKTGYQVSGVKTIVVNVNDNTFAATVTPVATGDYSSGTWEATVDTSKLGEDGSYQAKIIATDNAGVENEAATCLFKVDSIPPVVEIESPSNESALNGYNDFSGSVSEVNNLKSIEILYQFAVSKISTTNLSTMSKWKATGLKKVVGESDGDGKVYTFADISSWKFPKIDVNTYLGDNESGYLYILPVSVDEAGNKSVAKYDSEEKVYKEKIEVSDYKEYQVNLDSDRPIIKISSLTKASGDLLKYTSTINGVIEDDDGVIKTLRIKNEPFGTTPSSEGTKVTINSGSFSYTPKVKVEGVDKDVTDGTVNLYFYIEDGANGKFVTGSSDGKLKMPKVSFKSGTDYTTAGDNSVVISYTADSNPPEISDMKVGYGKTAELDLTTAATKLSAFKEKVGGKERQYIILTAKVVDTNGLESVNVSVGENEYAMTAGTGTNKDIYSAVIDISSENSGSKTITLTALDKSGISKTTNPLPITVDNDGPSISVITPAKDSVDAYAIDDLSDKLVAEIGDVTVKGSLSDSSIITDFRYLVINDDNYATRTTKVSEGTVGYDEETYDAEVGIGAVWDITLNTLPGNATELDKYKTKIVHNETSDVYAIPVYFYAKDELGNETVLSTYELKYNPYGDRPDVSISSPDDGAILNGSVQLSGAASDNVGINGVYLQIDANKDGKYDDKDITLLKAVKDNNGKDVYKIVKGTDNAFKNGDYSADDTTENFWGIEVKGGKNWNITVNKYKEFQTTALQKGNSTDAEKNSYVVKYRVASLDNNNKKSKWSDAQTFILDTNVPSVPNSGNIVGYTDSERTTVKYTKSYVADMYLVSDTNEKEPIYNELQIELSDDSGIQKIDYYLADSIADLNKVKDFETIEFTYKDTDTVPAGVVASAKRGGADDEKCYSKVTAKIPLSKQTGSTLAVKVIAYKNSDTETTAYCNYSVNFDDTAPTIEKITFNGDSATLYDSDSPVDNTIVNSNAIFTIGGKAIDDGSGFERLAFFYYRTSTKNGQRVYNPMVAPTTSGSTKTYGSEIKVGTSTKVTAATMNVGSDKMYGDKQTVTVSTDKKSLTLKTENTNIQSGGIVFIDGAWLRIKTVSGKSVTLDDSTPAAISGERENAFFPYVQVIDNTGTEKATWGSTENSAASFSNNSDDGDGMPESVIKSQTNYNFDASIRSNFIPDGPGYMYVFAFDKAGNVTSKCYKATVQNNAPRLTKLWLGTSLSSEPTAEEFVTYDILGTVGEKSSYVMETASYNNKKRFRVLGELGIAAEFVGGNNVSYDKEEDEYKSGIGLAFNNNPGSTEKSVAKTASNWFKADTGLSESAVLVKNNDAYSTWAYRIPAEKLGDDSESKSGVSEGYTKRSLSFTFWDNTTDTTQGSDSCYCYLRIEDFIILVEDKEAPNAVINPFYWTSASDNSLYENSRAKGHIELEKDITAAMATIYGAEKDPAVSGKISIRGQAYDAHTLGSIWIHMDDFTPTTKVTGATGTSPESITVSSEKYYKVAEFGASGWKVAAGAVSGKDWNFKVTPVFKGQQGHKVDWQLDIDTNGLDSGYKKNAKVKVLVRDAAWTTTASATHTSAADKTEGAAATGTPAVYDCETVNVPVYQMDVVPYITGITGARDRSKLGRYPITTTTTGLAVAGWNFGADGTIVRTNSSGTDQTTTLGDVDKGTSADLTCPSNSGYISIKWGSGTSAIRTINNINSNAAYNIEAGDSESLAKGKNYWTDDRYVSVWNVGTQFTGSEQPHDGSIEKGQSTTVKYTGSTKGTIGTNNNLFAIWGSDNNMLWDEVLGKSRSYTMCNSGSASGYFYGPPTQTDIAVVGNKVFYAVLDNGVKDATTFGSGLYLTREGKSLKNQEDGGHKAQIEKQSMLNQFRNPKIAGGFAKSSTGSTNSCYMYITYYDYKTHCLKYAHIEYREEEDHNNFEDALKCFTSRNKSEGLSGSVVIAGSDDENGGDVGTWSDVKVDLSTGTPIPVVTYYNKTDGKLYIVRATKTIPTKAADWGTPIEVARPSDSNDFGRYVSMEMSSNGDLFITAQDADSAKLYYMHYIFTKDGSGNGGTYSRDVITCVDAVNGAGRWTDIKLTDSSETGYDAGPVIIHQDPTRLNSKNALKTCILVDGKWDSMTVPAKTEPEDTKLSLVLSALDPDGKTDDIAVGYNSNMLCVDFLRGE